MIKKTLLIFVLLLILHIIVREKIKPEVTLSQSTSQINIIKGQTFLYDTTDVKYVLLGSSMSYHLQLNNSQKHIYNLALTGLSANPGIRLIEHRKDLINKKPNYVIIETNTLTYHLTDSYLDEAIFNPLLYNLRTYFPSLRDGKQPLPWLSVQLEKQVIPHLIPNKLTLFEDRLKLTPTYAKTSLKQEDILPNEGFKKQKKTEADKKHIENEITKNIKKIIDLNGIPIFFELPVNDENKNSETYKITRDLLNKEFIDKGYAYITYPADSNYQTYDGLHLTGTDVERYSRYLCTQIDSILTNSK